MNVRPPVAFAPPVSLAPPVVALLDTAPPLFAPPVVPAVPPWSARVAVLDVPPTDAELAPALLPEHADARTEMDSNLRLCHVATWITLQFNREVETRSLKFDT